ncbi:hypothetical protein CPLU01_08256 [Colletotrichum plurivorum]|uniref:Uncharacterized protein n=1 Tax=Colletotrichum plurivorum TaxID=2175906 RepID=A0A8H6KD67_9PEZI|nr:hypothetical protein CPLU01_08256 [Colletotrichum plurivorum]
MDPSSSTAVVQRLSGLDLTSSSYTSVADDDATNCWSDCWSALPYELFLIIVEEFLEAAEKKFRLDREIWCLRLYVTCRSNIGVNLYEGSNRRQKAFYKHILAVSTVSRKTRAIFRERFCLIPVAGGYFDAPVKPPRRVWASNKAICALYVSLTPIPPAVALWPSTCFQRVERLYSTLEEKMFIEPPDGMSAAFPSLKIFSGYVRFVRLPLPVEPHNHDEMLPLMGDASFFSLSKFDAARYQVIALRWAWLWEQGARILGYGSGYYRLSQVPDTANDHLVEFFPSPSHGVQFKFLRAQCDCYLEDGEGSDNAIEDDYYDSAYDGYDYYDYYESEGDYYPIEGDWSESENNGNESENNNNESKDDDSESEENNTDDNETGGQNNQGEGDQDDQNEGDN